MVHDVLRRPFLGLGQLYLLIRKKGVDWHEIYPSVIYFVEGIISSPISFVKRKLTSISEIIKGVVLMVCT
jgi:hypothetical protein